MCAAQVRSHHGRADIMRTNTCRLCAIAARLNTEFVRALRTPKVSARLSTDGALPVGCPAAGFAAYLRRELKKWGKVVGASGATVNQTGSSQ